MTTLKDQVHLVTGAASGIGAHLAAELLKRGARVCAVDINTAAMHGLHAHAEGDQLITAALDVRDAAQWQAVIEQVRARWQRLDVLMNVAGVIRPGWIHAFTAEDVHLQLDVNAKGVIFGTQAAARLMLEQGHGHIINIASLAGVAPVPGLALYSASKFAVRGFTLAAALELREKNIKVTAICPDAVQTPMLDLQVDREEAALTFSGSPSPLTVEDIGRVVFERALPRAPLEITLPGHRGAMAKLGSLLPGASVGLFERLRERGRARQRQRRGG
ncbi:SDR family oxidoreductase [Sinimarinibacterium thermocellulolyticum]|uniref:SDR family oxidoreductase n=1 Tax=Sinimarinibacterium thermocellulolyticum TaxID=3170016 RepID=A0ABV2A609_9GAMM